MQSNFTRNGFSSESIDFYTEEYIFRFPMDFTQPSNRFWSKKDVGFRINFSSSELKFNHRIDFGHQNKYCTTELIFEFRIYF